MRVAALALALAFLTAAVARQPAPERANGKIGLAERPYLPGSIVRIAVDGFDPPYAISVLGDALGASGELRIRDDARPGADFIVAGNAAGLAAGTLRVAAVPSDKRPLLAVASYDEGIELHDGSSFAPLGLFATGGAPSDVTIDARNRIVATDTQGDALAVAALSPWRTSSIGGVPFGDELAADDADGAIFATNRDLDGAGALTRVASDGSIARVKTGVTAEGLAIDARRGLVYVANVNDGTVAVVDASSMRVVRRFPAVDRVFSLALSPDGSRLYAVSNQSAASPFAAPGRVVTIALDAAVPHVVARSANLTFPIGIALDAAGGRLFVTDEADDAIDVLDARTLRATLAPLPTCHTPWKPALDAGRLYIPCARADAIDVYDVRMLHRVRGAPFATAGYPLAVAVWRP